MKYYKNLSIDENDYSVQRQGCRILNGLGFIMAYVTPFFQGGTWNP